MEFIGVIVATIAAFALGAVYYMVLSKPWMEASGVPVGEDGNPVNNASPVPYAVSFVAILLVSGMMRHTFELSGIDTVAKGFQSGLGVGLFFITPWIFINVGYANRPWKLAIIDGGYATLAATIIGVILTVL